jgi:hypothetical protein
MKQTVLLLVVVLLAFAIGMAQDDASKRSAAEKPEPSGHSAANAPQTAPLDGLAWMVGEWVDQGADATITTNCSWTKNRKFLTRSFQVATDDQVTLEGTQVVGWDPIARQIRSWTFDSEGGFGEGRWIHDGPRWLVKTSFVLASGERASALNVITYVNQDTFRWQSVDREVGGELLPSIPEVTITRQKREEVGAEQRAEEVSK